MQKELKKMKITLKKIGSMGVILAVLSSCSTDVTKTDVTKLDKEIAESLEKNPNLIFQAIEKNPERFFEVVNRAAQDMKRVQYEKEMQARESEFRADLEKPKRPKVTLERILEGRPGAKIEIVEYADFQCPACAVAFHGMEEFKAKHKGDFLFVFKHMPLSFHKMAYPAALYFEAIKRIDKIKALQFYRSVYAHQERLTSEIELNKIAHELGVKDSQLKTLLKDKGLRELIEADMKEFSDFGFSGTPVVIMNGVALSGAHSADDLEIAYKKMGHDL